MAARKPLVLVNGQIQQLQAGDYLSSSGVSITLNNANAGALAIGNIVYISGANSADKARANASGTAQAFAFVQDTAITSGNSGSFLDDGVLSATTTQWDSVTGQTGGLTAGAKYYLSASVAGNMSTTPPSSTGEYIVELGRALSPTDFSIEIGAPILL